MFENMKISTLWACDLDGTVLVPARLRRDGDVPVESVSGEERSFLPVGFAEVLRGFPPDVLFVPVTSRSIVQYGRIRWPDGCAPRFAVVANGGWFLGPGGRERLTCPDPAGLESAREALSAYPGLCRVVDGSYAYLHLDRDADTGSVHVKAPDGYRVHRAGRKFYVIPPGGDKADAVAFLADRFGPSRVLAAGDGTMDEGMVEAADAAFVPCGWAGRKAFGIVVCPEGIRFSDFLWKTMASGY